MVMSFKKIQIVFINKTFAFTLHISLYLSYILLSAAMPGRLSVEHMDQLEEWISSGPKQFHLLYSITRDGCGPTPFHKMCDNRCPTVTVVYNPQGSVYGGYTSLAWESSGGYTRDDQAFLFQLVFSYEKLVRKFNCTKTGTSVCHHDEYGPMFGSGDDLCLFQYKNVNDVNGVYVLFNAGGCMTQSDSFVYDDVKAADINNGTMNVVEIEVYSVIGALLFDH